MSTEIILLAFGFDANTAIIQPFGTGLINHTWLVNADQKKYILQRVNHQVFKNPRAIASNIDSIGDYLLKHKPDYLFTRPLLTVHDADSLYTHEDEYYRMFPFIEGSHSIDVVDTPSQAYEAAKQFGRFTKHLNHFDSNALQTTIPNFHNINLRFEQFNASLKNGNPERIKEARPLINKILNHKDIVSTYNAIQSSDFFKLRVTHHDTKISNVLFDENDEGICVIDLDTVMPGYFISDVGDMMRTYLSPVSEEELDLHKINVRALFYEAVVQGYFEEMKDILTEQERSYFFYAGQFLIYMQALRFITDHLNNDVYYGAKYPGHNLKRAENQMVLLERLLEQKDHLFSIV